MPKIKPSSLGKTVWELLDEKVRGPVREQLPPEIIKRNPIRPLEEIPVDPFSNELRLKGNISALKASKIHNRVLLEREGD